MILLYDREGNCLPCIQDYLDRNNVPFGRRDTTIMNYYLYRRLNGYDVQGAAGETWDIVYTKTLSLFKFECLLLHADDGSFYDLTGMSYDAFNAFPLPEKEEDGDGEWFRPQSSGMTRNQLLTDILMCCSPWADIVWTTPLPTIEPIRPFVYYRKYFPYWACTELREVGLLDLLKEARWKERAMAAERLSAVNFPVPYVQPSVLNLKAASL